MAVLSVPACGICSALDLSRLRPMGFFNSFYPPSAINDDDRRRKKVLSRNVLISSRKICLFGFVNLRANDGLCTYRTSPEVRPLMDLCSLEGGSVASS